MCMYVYVYLQTQIYGFIWLAHTGEIVLADLMKEATIWRTPRW